MELLYLIDRSVTGWIQSLSIFISRRLRIDAFWQSMIAMFMTYPLRSLYGYVYHINEAGGPFYVSLLYLGLLLTSAFIGMGFGSVLNQLHHFFDPDGFNSTDKLYWSGNLAWGHVTFAATCLILALLFHANGFMGYIASLGFFALAPNAYIVFTSRRRGSGGKKKKPITERLRKLIEASRSWLPKPAPIPS